MVRRGSAFCNCNNVSSKEGTVIIGEELTEQDAWKYSLINSLIMFSRILKNNGAKQKDYWWKFDLFLCRKYSQEKTLLKTIQLNITVSRSRKSRSMPCDDFCFIWLRGASNVARDMRCCDSGTSVSRILIPGGGGTPRKIGWWCAKPRLLPKENFREPFGLPKNNSWEPEPQF